MLTAQRQGKTSFYMQSTGEEAVACAFPRCAARRRHELPHVSTARPARRRGLSACSHGGAGVLERARPGPRTPDAGDVFRGATTASSRSRATSPRSTCRQSGGRWPRPSRVSQRSPPDGSATARRRNPTSTRTRLRVDVPPAGDPVHRQQPMGDLDPRTRVAGPGAVARGTSSWLRTSRAARRRERLPGGPRRDVVGRRARLRRARPDADRMGDLPRGGTLHVRRPLGVSRRRRARDVAPRRPDRPATPTPVGTGRARRRRLPDVCMPTSRARCSRPSRRPSRTARCTAVTGLPRPRCSTTCTSSMPAHLRAQRQAAGY